MEQIESLEARMNAVEQRTASLETRAEIVGGEIDSLRCSRADHARALSGIEVVRAKVEALEILPHDTRKLSLDLVELRGRVYGALAVVTILIPIATAVAIKLIR